MDERVTVNYLFVIFISITDFDLWVQARLLLSWR